MEGIRGSIWVVVFAWWIILVGCESNAERQARSGPSGPGLIHVDNILLPEAQEYYVGNPLGAVFDPYDGSIYISDEYTRRVLRFDRNGHVIRTYGRPGAGPGELQGSGLVFVMDDSTVAVEDWTALRLKLFDRETGEPRLEEYPFPWMAGMTPPVRIENDLWFPMVDRETRRALGRWQPGSETLETLGDMPDVYHASLDGGNPGYANYMIVGAMALHDDLLVRAWQPSNDLIRYRPDGTVVDTIRIPAVRRLGVTANAPDVYDGRAAGNRLTDFSKFRQLHVLPDGGVAFTHHDNEVISLDAPMPVLAPRVWIGVLSPDLDKACVDTPVPASTDARAMEAFRGDTLFVLDRRIVDDDRLETLIKAYRIDTTECEWIPVPESRPEGFR